MERIAYTIRHTAQNKWLRVTSDNRFGTSYSLTQDYFGKTLFENTETAKRCASAYIKNHKTSKVTDFEVVEVFIKEESTNMQSLAPEECIFYPMSWGKIADDVIHDEVMLTKMFYHEYKAVPQSYDKELWETNNAAIRCYNIVW